MHATSAQFAPPQPCAAPPAPFCQTKLSQTTTELNELATRKFGPQTLSQNLLPQDLASEALTRNRESQPPITWTIGTHASQDADCLKVAATPLYQPVPQFDSSDDSLEGAEQPTATSRLKREKLSQKTSTIMGFILKNASLKRSAEDFTLLHSHIEKYAENGIAEHQIYIYVNSTKYFIQMPGLTYIKEKEYNASRVECFAAIFRSKEYKLKHEERLKGWKWTEGKAILNPQTLTWELVEGTITYSNGKIQHVRPVDAVV